MRYRDRFQRKNQFGLYNIVQGYRKLIDWGKNLAGLGVAKQSTRVQPKVSWVGASLRPPLRVEHNSRGAFGYATRKPKLTCESFFMVYVL